MTTPVSSNQRAAEWGTDETAVAQQARQSAKSAPTQSTAAPAQSSEPNESESPRAHQSLVKGAMKPSPSVVAAHAKASGDCAKEAVTTTLACATGAALVVAGTATGPGELVVLGIAGGMCGAAYIDYYDCVTAKRP